MKDAGTYNCLEGGTNNIVPFELIVLGSDPVCTLTLRLEMQYSVEEYSNINMTCSVVYSGNWAPVMTWQQDGGAVITDGVVNNTVAYRSVTYSLTVLATRNLTGSKYNCTTHFAKHTKHSSSNVIAPEYVFTWSFPAVNVPYAASNARISPRRSVYRVGDQLRCAADGNPSPTYEWKDLVNGGVYVGPTVPILNVKQTGFQCTATNTVAGRQRLSVNNITFTVGDEAFERVYTISGIAAGVSAGIILVLLMTIGIICYQKRKTDYSAANTLRELIASSNITFQRIGTDGTQYAELALMTEKPSRIKKAVRIKPHFDVGVLQTTVYAQIHHGVVPPP